MLQTLARLLTPSSLKYELLTPSSRKYKLLTPSSHKYKLLTPSSQVQTPGPQFSSTNS